MSTAPDFNEALRALVAAIVAETVPRVVAAVLADRDGETMTAEQAAAAGLCTARQFQDAARAGSLPCFRGGTTGRAPVARRADVLSWLSTRTARPRKRKVIAANDAEPAVDSFADAYDAIARRAG